MAASEAVFCFPCVESRLIGRRGLGHLWAWVIEAGLEAARGDRVERHRMDLSRRFGTLLRVRGNTRDR